MIDIFTASGLNRVNINAAIARAVTVNEDPILNLNRTQLNQGRKSDGSSLGQYSNIKYKGFLKPVNLYKTGEWRSQMSIDVGYREFTIYNHEEKTVWLVKRYSGTILGLTIANENKAAVLLKPDIIRELNRQIGI